MTNDEWLMTKGQECGEWDYHGKELAGWRGDFGGTSAGLGGEGTFNRVSTRFRERVR